MNKTLQGDETEHQNRSCGVSSGRVSARRWSLLIDERMTEKEKPLRPRFNVVALVVWGAAVAGTAAVATADRALDFYTSCVFDCVYVCLWRLGC